MTRNQSSPAESYATAIPDHPIISDCMHRDTLDRVVHIIELLEELNLSHGLPPGARTGLYWIHRMLADSVQHVSDSLEPPHRMPGSEPDEL